MFKAACQELAKQVRPIVVVTKHGSRPPQFAVGASVMVNEKGWILTAAHVVRAALQALVAYREFGRLSEHDQQERLKQHPETTITHAGVQWGTWDNPTVAGEILFHKSADLALVRLTGFRNPSGYRPPIFRIDAAPGESLCRVGYALLDDISVSFEGDSFTLDQAPPLFVNEGIVSRYASDSGVDHIEMTSPGLVGQSGGPVADTQARVCGVQVRTRHYRLGFGVESAMHHVGQAVHASVVCDFLRSNSIYFHGDGRRETQHD